MMSETAKSREQGPISKGAGLSFSSEALLQQAIAGLLTRLPGITGVQILQGSQELGKDIIFYFKGGFTESVLCSCVVKNTKITGDVSRPGGARTVLFQAEQAFDSVHTNSFGEDIRVERVYVITPFDLPPSTITSIRGKLGIKNGQVKFMGGTELFDLFKAYWSDYFVDEAAAIEQHLDNTRSILADESPLPALSFQYALGSVSTKSLSVYVTQDFHREVYDYTTGPVLDLPDPQMLFRSITNDDIDSLEKAFSRFDAALAHFHEWNLDSPNYQPSRLERILNRFLAELREDWTKSVKSQPSLTASRIARCSGAAHLAKTMSSIIQDRDGCLSRLDTELGALRKVIASRRHQGLDALSNKEFCASCAMNDCARAAPEGVLVQRFDSLRVDLPKDILRHWGGHLVIAGSPGYGKTSFCRWHALQDAENLNTKNSRVLPIYFPLHQLARKELGSFKNTFLKTIGKSALTTVPGRKSPQRIRLYLDGLDEIASPLRRREVVDLVRKGVSKNNKYQVIITARDYVFGPWLEWIPKVYLSEFGDTEITLFLNKWLGTNSALNKQFCQQLDNVPSLRALMRTPLLATLTVMVFKQTGRLPESKNRLYEIFIDLLSGGWDIVKGVNRGSKYGQKIKVLILTSLAERLHTNRRRSFGESAIKTAIQSVSSSMLNQLPSLRTELITDGLISQSGGVLNFSHLSFQEFLAAKALMGTPHHSRVLAVLELYLYGNNWWRDVLRFYVGLASSPEEITSWLAHQIDHFKTQRYKKVSAMQAYEILGSVIESFPEYPAAEIARKVERSFDYKTTLSFLKLAQERVNRGKGKN